MGGLLELVVGQDGRYIILFPTVISRSVCGEIGHTAHSSCHKIVSSETEERATIDVMYH